MRPFEPYLIKTVAGVRIAIIGITTPAIPELGEERELRGLLLDRRLESALRDVESLREQGAPGSRHPRRACRNRARPQHRQTEKCHPVPAKTWSIASPPKSHGIDALIFGHSHQVFDADASRQHVRYPTEELGRLARRHRIHSGPRSSGGPWRVAARTGKLLPGDPGDSRRPADRRDRQALSRGDGSLAEHARHRFPGHARRNRARSRTRPSSTPSNRRSSTTRKADVSFASAFNPRARVKKGPVTIRQIAALYIYDNELFAIEGNGRMVREALENAARFFKSCPDPACSSGPLLNRDFMSFNFDMAQGVTYDIDLTQPEGSRIRNLRFRGEPLEDTRPLRIAINSYRAGGSGGYSVFRDAKVVWRSYRDIRDLMVDYYSGHPLPVKPDGNWRSSPSRPWPCWRPKSEPTRRAMPASSHSELPSRDHRESINLT